MPIGDFSLAAGEVSNLPVTLQADPMDLKQTNTKISFKVEAVADKNVTAQVESRFLSPSN